MMSNFEDTIVLMGFILGIMAIISLITLLLLYIFYRLVRNLNTHAFDHFIFKMEDGFVRKHFKLLGVIFLIGVIYAFTGYVIII